MSVFLLFVVIWLLYQNWRLARYARDNLAMFEAMSLIAIRHGRTHQGKEQVFRDYYRQIENLPYDQYNRFWERIAKQYGLTLRKDKYGYAYEIPESIIDELVETALAMLDANEKVLRKNVDRVRNSL